MVMKQPKPRMRKLKRSVHIDEEEWTYQVGSCITFIRSPDLTKTWRRFTSEVAGLTPEAYDRDRWKGNFKGVTPQMIKDYILEKILPDYHRGVRSSGGAAKTGFAFSGEIAGVR